jgi:hypothetical protein
MSDQEQPYRAAAETAAMSEPSEVQTEERAVPQEAKTDMQAKTLYMFSDMEGCQVLDRSGNPNSNSIAMCDPGFYNKLDEMMENNKNMHVAFLGDYFDQGLQVIPSLQGMSDLYDKYREKGTKNENGANRVFIILGNRDINKLRFMYELTHELTPPTQGWSEWDGFYKGLAGKKDVELVKHILSKSMGAGLVENASKFVGLHSFIPPDYQKDKTDDDALAYLKASFGMETGLLKYGGGFDRQKALQYSRNVEAQKKLSAEITRFKFDILAFYNKCKIAHVFDLGNSENVLLAHGGGFNKGCFFNKAYIESFGQGNGGNVTPANYLQMMEDFRIKLSQQPVAEMMAETVQESVDVYNQLLLDVVTELTTKTNDDEKYTWKFVLLQALGLKPDPDTSSNNEDKLYNSLIQSCSQVNHPPNGCTGPSTISPTDEASLYQYLQKSGITHVSYGHKPVCFPIPLIYRRTADDINIMFISNDTSNGNRRTEDLGSTIVVGTKIDSSSNPSVASICYISIPGKSSSAKDETDFNTRFKSFLDLKLTKNTAPQYTPNAGVFQLAYADGPIVSMNMPGFATGFNKLNFTFTPPQSQPPQPSEGGRRSRRRRYTKKIKQRSKRRVQKKRAATRAKRERKTRK